MIRVEFNVAQFASWAHEMLTHRHILDTLRAQGVPVTGRLVFSGIERGRITYVQEEHGGTLLFNFAEAGEQPGEAFKQTHTAAGVKVFKSGEHLRAYEATEEDLF